MFQYTVFFDYEVNGVWTYNQEYTTHFNTKGLHNSAELEASDWIKANFDNANYRVTKVYCD